MTYYCILVDVEYGYWNVLKTSAENKEIASSKFLDYFKNNISYFLYFLNMESEDFEESEDSLKKAKTLEEWKPSELDISLLEFSDDENYIGFIVDDYNEVPNALSLEASSEMDAINKFMYRGFYFLYNFERNWDYQSANYWLNGVMSLGNLNIVAKDEMTEI